MQLDFFLNEWPGLCHHRPGHSLGKNNKVTRNEKWKKQLWVFVYIKYGKFWSTWLGHFIKHIPLISEEFTCVVVNSITSYITKLLCTPTHITVGVIIVLFAVFCSSFVTSVRVMWVRASFHTLLILVRESTTRNDTHLRNLAVGDHSIQSISFISFFVWSDQCRFQKTKFG